MELFGESAVQCFKQPNFRATYDIELVERLSLLKKAKFINFEGDVLNEDTLISVTEKGKEAKYQN